MKRVKISLLALMGMSVMANASVNLSIGDQKGGIRAVLEASGALQGAPYHLTWTEFPAAAPLAEALNANAIDLGYIGDAPLLFAQAGGAQVKAVAVAKYDPYGTALIVTANSPIKTVADLKGKSIATNRGSIGHYLALRALAKAGINANAVTFRFLPPADAKLALMQGDVDAWATWEPYTSYAEIQDHMRIIANGRGLRAGNTFIAATQRTLNSDVKRAALQDFINRLAKAQQWANQHPQQYSQTLAKIIGFPEAVVKLSFTRANARWQQLDSQTLREQQQTADFYFQSHLLPKHFDVTPTFDAHFTVKE